MAVGGDGVCLGWGEGLSGSTTGLPSLSGGGGVWLVCPGGNGMTDRQADGNNNGLNIGDGLDFVTCERPISVNTPFYCCYY